MAKVLVQLVLSTMNAEGENHRLNSVSDVTVRDGIDPALATQTGIVGLMGDDGKTLSLPMGRGHVSIRGSAIEWVYCENVPDDKAQSNEVNLADIATTLGTIPGD